MTTSQRSADDALLENLDDLAQQVEQQAGPQFAASIDLVRARLAADQLPHHIQSNLNAAMSALTTAEGRIERFKRALKKRDIKQMRVMWDAIETTLPPMRRYFEAAMEQLEEHQRK